MGPRRATDARASSDDPSDENTVTLVDSNVRKQFLIQRLLYHNHVNDANFQACYSDAGLVGIPCQVTEL